MRRGWKGRRGKENKTCEPALPQPQQGLGGTRRRRRFASSSSSMAGGQGREHARLPAIRILLCKPGTSTCAEQGSSSQCSKPSARRCFEWSTAGISNGRCRVMPGGAAHLTGSPGLVFLQGSNPAQSRVSEEGDTSPSWSQPVALGEQQRWRRTHPSPLSPSRSGSRQGAQGGSHSAERNGTQPKHQTFELVWKSQVVVVPLGCTINTKPKPAAELSREKVFKSNPFRRGFLGPCRTQYLSHLPFHLKHGLRLWTASTFSAFSGKKKIIQENNKRWCKRRNVGYRSR